MSDTPLLQRIYDSEINFELSTFWDSGFFWKLGDAMNGIKADGSAPTLAEATAQLCEAAVKHFPKSDFARFFARGPNGSR